MLSVIPPLKASLQPFALKYALLVWFVVIGITLRYEHPLWGFAHCGILASDNIHAQTICVKEQFYIRLVCTERTALIEPLSCEEREGYKKDQFPFDGAFKERELAYCKTYGIGHNFKKSLLLRYNAPIVSRCKYKEFPYILFCYPLSFILF